MMNILPESYIACDLAKKTKYISIKSAYEKNDLSIIVRGSFWYAGRLPRRITKTVYREMERLYPYLSPLFEMEEYDGGGKAHDI